MKRRNFGGDYGNQCTQRFERDRQRDRPGAVNTEVVIELLNGGEIVSIITKDSAERLALTNGKEVYAVVKASDVMVAID